MATGRKRFVVCLDNEGYEASLERRKIYQVLPDSSAERTGHIRVVDESGEDYLFPRRLFEDIELSPALKRAVLAAE